MISLLKKLVLLSLICACLVTPVLAQCDFIDSLNDWNAFYITYKIKGYPTYNAAMARYDFFDLDDNYCGSLCYNNIVEQWEYIGL